MSVENKYADDFAPADVVQDYSKIKMSIGLHNFHVQVIATLLKEHGKIRSGKRQGRLLDVGCGNGVLTGHLAKYFEHAIGIDTSPSMIAKANETNGFANTEFKVGGGENMPIPDNSVDIITTVLSTHFMNVDNFLTDCRRVLDVGGIVVIYTNFPSMITSVSDETLAVIVDEVKLMIQDALNIATVTNHPERYVLDGYRSIYNAIQWPKKQKVLRQFHIEMDMAAFRKYRLSIPFYGNLGTSEKNPVVRMLKRTKEIWSMEDVDEKDISIRITFDASVIVLS